MTRVANGAASDAPVRIDPRARTEILIAVLLAVFLAALDQTIVGTALPRIVDDLKGNEFYTWVVTIYLLTATNPLLPARAAAPKAPRPGPRGCPRTRRIRAGAHGRPRLRMSWC